MDPTVDRLTGYLRALVAEYPDIWRQVATFHEGRGQDLPNWAPWCYLPLSASFAIASQGAPLETISPADMLRYSTDVARIGALVAWRATQGIYRFDPEILEAVWDTPMSREIPVDLLYRLPEWCVYIETPGKHFGDRAMLGVFVHLEHDVQEYRHELRLVMDLDRELIGFPLHIMPGVSIEHAVDLALQESRRQLKIHAPTGPAQAHRLETGREITLAVTPVVSLVVYLCSLTGAEDIRDSRGTDRLPGLPTPVKVKGGAKIIPPSQPTVWETGYRIGAALKRAREAEQGEPRGDAVEGRSAPSPHIRRAHWHSYWTGKQAEPEARKIVVKWIPPIPVGLKDGDMIPTIRPVK